MNWDNFNVIMNSSGAAKYRVRINNWIGGLYVKSKS